MAIPFTFKNIFKAKEELWKLKYNFTMQKTIFFKKKKSKKKPKILHQNIIITL
jgi:hypothetical protein